MKIILLITIFCIVLFGCENFEEIDNPSGSGPGQTIDYSKADNLGFIAVHMEVFPGSRNTSKTTYQEETWPNLVKLIALADQYDFKLTLQFNPQWATYLTMNHSLLSILNSWERFGHEVALHHHGPSHGDWNGYSNDTKAKSKAKSDLFYLGDIENVLMPLMKEISLSSKILSGGITNEDTDWPEGVLYDTDGGDPDDLTSFPTKKVFNGHNVIQLRYRVCGTSTTPADASINEVENSYSELINGKILGIVFHAMNFTPQSPTHDKIKSLFSSLNSNNINIKTVKEILSNYDPDKIKDNDSSEVENQFFCGDGFCGEKEKLGIINCPTDCS